MLNAELCFVLFKANLVANVDIAVMGAQKLVANMDVAITGAQLFVSSTLEVSENWNFS